MEHKNVSNAFSTILSTISSPITITSSIHLKIIKLLIDCKVDINHKNNLGDTGFILACEYGYLEVVKLLIIEGSYINIKNTLNKTGFTHCYHRHKEHKEDKKEYIQILYLLISFGYDYTLDEYIDNEHIKMFNKYKDSIEFYNIKRELYEPYAICYH